jgi:hypothetical protein
MGTKGTLFVLDGTTFLGLMLTFLAVAYHDDQNDIEKLPTSNIR